MTSGRPVGAARAAGKKRLRVSVRPAADASNRFVALFATALARAGAEVSDYAPTLRALLRSDVAIIHWPNEFLGPTSRREALLHLARIRLARLFGTRLVWVAHNLGTHDGGGDHDFVPAAFIASLDGVVYLSDQSRALIRARHPIPAAAVEVVTVHGCYDALTPASDFAAPPPDAPVRLLNFGLIRPYKNLDELVAAAGGLDRVALRIAGRRHDPAYAATIGRAVAAHPHIVADFRDDLLSDVELEGLVDGSDGVALPYRDILNSGSALLALSRNRPVLVPAIGGMPALRDAVGRAWVMLYEGGLTSAHLAAFADFVRVGVRGSRPDLRAFAWERVSDDLRGLLTSLRTGRALA